MYIKVQIGGAIRKKFPLHKPRGGERLKLHLGTNTKKTYRKPSEQLFSKGGHSVTRTELKYINVHKAQTAQQLDSKTQNNKNRNRIIALER